MTAFFFLDVRLLLLMLPFTALAAWASWRVKSTFQKYSQQRIRSGHTGASAAQAILRGAGLDDVRIEAVPGMLSDHYDPQQRVVRLSQDVLRASTPAAVAVAAHECGHALQHAQDYRPMQWRSSIVPVANLGSQFAFPMILIGLAIGSTGLAMAGIIAFSLAVLFHVVTLPVEFDASHRAIRILEQSGIAAADEMVGVRKTLYAAGFTYIASTLIAVVQLVYFLVQSGLLGGDD